MDGKIGIEPGVARHRERGVLGHGDEGVGRRRIGPALQQAGQQQITLVPADELVIVVDRLTPGQQLLRLQLDQNGRHQQEFRKLIERDLVPLLHQDAHERIDHRQQRDVEHIDLM